MDKLINQEVLETVSIVSTHYILAGFSIVVGLSWNNTVKEFIDDKFPRPKQKINANLIYSIVLTLFLVLMVYLLPNAQSQLPINVQKQIQESKDKQQDDYFNSYLSDFPK